MGDTHVYTHTKYTQSFLWQPSQWQIFQNYDKQQKKKQNPDADCARSASYQQRESGPSPDHSVQRRMEKPTEADLINKLPEYYGKKIYKYLLIFQHSFQRAVQFLYRWHSQLPHAFTKHHSEMRFLSPVISTPWQSAPAEGVWNSIPVKAAGVPSSTALPFNPLYI